MARVFNFRLYLIFLLFASGSAFAQCFVHTNFSAAPTCRLEVTHFTDSTTYNPGNSITSWHWDFGDGGTSPLQNPIHAYVLVGPYNVSLTVTTTQGCSDTKTIQINVYNDPIASFSVNPSPVTCNDEFINYTNTSVGINLTYLWTFGSDGTSTLQNPQHAVPFLPNSCAGNNYNTTLTVTDVHGCTASVSQNITIQPRPSAQIVSASDHICAIYTNGHYIAEHTLFNMANAPCLLSYLINWGDGTPLVTGSIDSVDYTHTYTLPGFFPITVYGIGGACSTVVFRDTVLIEITPTAGIIGPSASWTNGCTPFPTFFILNSNITTTTTQTVIWGGMDTVALPPSYLKGDTVWHTFMKSGCDSLGVMTPYNVILKDQNLCGSSITSWGNFNVYRPPIASFTIPDTICKNDFVTFQNTTKRNLCGGWTLTQFNWKVFKNGSLIINSNFLVSDLTPALPNFNFAFSDTGTYVIKLTSTDNGNYGCGSTQFSKTVYVQGTFANFWSDTICLGNPTFFHDSSHSVYGNLTSWHWDFGDGTQSNDTNAVHTFATAGFHNVTLTVFDSNNCSDTITKQAYVSPYPVANFTYDTVCIGSITNFNDLSFTTAIDSVISWKWYFGDGDSSSLQNPAHIYAGAGLYNTTLIVSTTFSCPDTITKIVYISPFPDADFNSDIVCLGSATSFFDLSTTTANDSIIYWAWNFGDGTLSNDTNPIHTFNTEGFHNVTLIVSTSIGCNDTIQKPVYVSPLPIANFNFDTVCIGFPVHFNDLSHTNAIDTIAGWFWSFGDSITSDSINPDHFYPDTGYFSVTLVVTTTFGCTDSITKSIYVNPYPVVHFSSTQVCLGDTTQFTDSTTTSPIDHIIGWNWDFGDSVTSTLQNPTHVYLTAGYHSVTLNTVSAVGCDKSDTHNAYVSPFPVANFTTQPVCIGQPNVFNNLSSTTGIHPINQWHWAFGDGTIDTTQSPTHIFSDTGVYDVSLVVTSSLGCVSDTIHHTTYASPYPVADFIASTVCLTHTTTFNDLSYTLANDNIIAWHWSFGDGSTSNQQHPQHLYSDSGYYNVTLIVFSSIGCTDTIIKPVYVKPLPVPNFTAPAVCLGHATVFTDLSTVPAVEVINNWSWSFGDGIVSSQQNPNHIYADTGLFNVSLIVSTNLGCADSITKNVYVSSMPEAIFKVDSVCLGTPSNFNELSFTLAQDSIITWSWNFGDGNTSSLQNPFHTYSDTGHFTVNLIVSTSIGCTDTAQNVTYISPYPHANFIADTACLGIATIFSDLSTTDAIDNIVSWSWNFGDGSTSFMQNPTHLYTDTGFYNVVLIVSSQIGCTDTLAKKVYVKPIPSPAFAAIPSCIGSPTIFTDLSYSSAVDTINSWFWKFGDGSTSNLQNPNHIYSHTGYFNVTLIISSSIGCSDSISKLVYVSPYPVAGFNSDTVCLGNATSFTNISYTLANDSIISWHWNFGDGTSSTLQNPSHLYAGTGYVSVSLIVSTSIGCSDTINRNIYVSPYPTASFKADTACLGFSTSFTDLSHTSAIDNIIAWHWNFGDGSTSNIQNPLHTYGDSGNYTVSLVVSSTFGCSDTIIKTVYVNAPPVSGFSATTVCLGNATLFTDQSTASIYDDIISWQWNFGDGTSSNQQSPSHLYADTGYFSVSLKVNSLLGCSDTKIMNVYVSPYPVAGFNSDTVCLGNATSFTNISYTSANDDITSWNWNFGDGTSSILQNPSHLYADTGFVNVSLIVSTTIGCSDTIYKNVYVSPYPTAAYKADTACLGYPTSFSDLSYTPAIDNIIAWHWNFGDGATSNNQNPQHTYADSGNYTVGLVVSSTFGCSDTIIKTVYVNAPPVSHFSATTVCLGNTTFFTNQSTASIYDNIISWQWYFGDGTSSNQQNPTHLYADTGYFSVSLTVFSLLGCSDTAMMNVYISPYPIAGFNSDTVCLGNTTSFTDLSYTLANDSIISWSWDFGDGTTSSLQNPSHLYADTGYVNVSLIVSTSIGCSDTIHKNIYITPYPTAAFKADTACKTWATSFIDLSATASALGSIADWFWDFGDGTTSNLQNPTHIYPDSGYYWVTLISSSNFGCSDTVTQSIFVKPLPVPDFSASTVCLGNNTIYFDLSTSSSIDTVISWTWYFGDGTSSNMQNPVHLFADTGLFTTTLIVSSSIGCSDSISKDVYVSPYPVADFTSDTICFGNSTHFTNISYTLANDSIVSWQWDFGDGNNSALQNPVHLYADTGYFNVTLIINSSIGCSDTISKNTYVSPLPVANFSADSACFSFSTTFSDLSITHAIDSIVAWHWNFGDGNSSTQQNPSHLYADSGNYNVTLICFSKIGCSDSVAKNVYVKPLPNPDFSALPVCFGENTVFNDLSSASQNDNITGWLWHFENAYSSLQNPTYIFSDTGVFNVTLIAYSLLGCSDSIKKDVYVSPYPVSNFKADTVCLSYPTSFSDLSYLHNSDSITSWSWNFGDGSSSSLQNPQHIYTDTGFYNVSLIITSSIGCSDTINKAVYVSPSPIADFSADNVCLGNPTTFNDLSYTLAIDTIQAWSWDFGDGNTSNTQNPQHTYTDTGFYAVTLTIESTIGCPNNVVKNVYVSPPPIAKFVADTVCFGINTSFTDMSYTMAADNINSWLWQFDDGNSSSSQNPIHLYADTGHYNVQLKVTSAIGCSDSIIHKIYISPYPTADFTADTACIGAETTFSNLSYTTAVDSIISWEWNFGDGISSNLKNPVHQYSTSGIYNVSLIVNSAIACSDTIIKNVYVSPLPIAEFIADTVCLGTTTTFNNISSTSAIDSIMSWNWDFGDGHFSVLQNPTNLYANAGLYTVSLIVSSSLGCSDTILHDVYVSPIPHANFISDTVCLGFPTLFSDLSTTLAFDSINQWMWQLGDSSFSYIQNPTHIYADTGHYNVNITVTSSLGCSDTITKTIYVSPYPFADFKSDTVCLSLPTTFTNLSYTNAIDSIIAWEWNFGDGNTSGQQNPVHAYSLSGNFNVSLIVHSAIACTDTIIKVVYVSPPPVAQFKADSVCLGAFTNFTDLSNTLAVDSIINWAWNFGDGDSSNLQHPIHQYADTGYYSVNLEIVTSLGCSNTVAHNVYVKPLPVANFDALPACFGYSTFFNDLSHTANNDSIYSWSWNFGDSSFSNLQNPLHLYSDSGTYNVMLVVSSYMGCTDTISKPVNVIPLPIAEFTANPVCFGDNVTFNDLSDASGYFITNWLWYFGDGDTSTLQNPTHNYTQPGNYSVTLIVKNEYNCVDSISHSVSVYDIPFPDFTFNDVCLNVNTLFNDSSNIVNNSIVLWQWNFGDGDTSVIQNPVHLYADFGTYNVSLTITDSVGCTDSISKQVTVYPLPVAAFVTDSICSGDTAHFHDASTTSSGNIDSWQWNFGDSLGVANVQNPDYYYNSISSITNFNVNLIVSNSHGCYDTVNQLIHINPLPVAQFSADTACFGIATHFNDLSYSSGGALNSWSWAFGDGTGYDTIANPTYLYHNTGLFLTTLTVTDVKGCSQTVTQSVLVDSLPIPSFEWCQVCRINQLLPVEFVNTSQGNGSTIVNNYWDFGNGQTSTLNDSVTANYDAAGSYNVTLRNTNNRGCSDSITIPITVHSGLTVDFTSQVNCFNISFNATSDNATSLVEWEWNFGDGSYSNQHDSAQHTYFQPGTYQITLTVYDSLPCMGIVCVQSVSHYIYIYPPPIADFSATNVLVGTPTVFTDLSSAPQSSIVSWLWDFGDGNSSTSQSPVYTYGQYGIYNVTLTIVNSFGCSDSITQTVIVYAAVIANFDSATICTQTPLTFNNTSQILLPGITVTWHWDFGDGNTSSDSLPTHTYNLPGIYNVTLIVSMASGIADTAIHQIIVIETPIADFTFTEVCWGDTLTSFHDNSYSSVPLVQWQWNLGDGTLSGQPNVSHNYLQYGTYNVQLIVSNSNGCIDSINKNVRVFDVPSVSFDASPKLGCMPMSVMFNDLSTVNDANIVNWLWDFGDGFGSVGYADVNHIFIIDGVYDITLTVMSSQGCYNTFTIPSFVQVYPKPNADFTYSPTVPLSTDLVQFHNISTESNHWEWYFGDGSNSNEFNPVHVFDEGIYTTCMMSRTHLAR